MRLGTVLDGRYRLDRLLGEGGMGTVYRAHHLAMDRPVAVKVLRGSLARDPIAARRFALEAKATTKVDSPNAVKVFDFGITHSGGEAAGAGGAADTASAEYFMVMEYLDGRTAQRELDIDGPMSMRRALHVGQQALAGLAAAHAVGVIHRDIKPENLLLMRVGNDPDFCKVLDFGVAKLMVQSAEPGTALTRDGMVFGTPEFMSPEQACGQPLDGRSDLYSLAATLFTLLTGEPLFRGASAIEVLSKHVTKPPPRLVDRRGLHHLHALDQVLQRALAKRPAERHRDAAELAAALAFLAPPLELHSQPATPTVSTPSLPLPHSATPDSPLGVLLADARPSALPTGASPLFVEPSHDRPDSSMPPSASPPGASGPWGTAEHAAPTPGASLAPGVAMPTGFRPAMTGYLPRVSMELEPSPSTEAMHAAMHAALPPRRSRLALLAGALLLLAGLGVTAWQLIPAGVERPQTGQLAQRDDAPTVPPPSRDAGEAPADGRVVARPADAAIAEARDAAPLTADAAIAEARDAAPPAADAGPVRPIRDPAAEQRKIREFLAEARQSRADDNPIRQIAYANNVLELAPRHREALLLLAEALLKSGDTKHGCKTLTKLRGSAEAAALAANAGCP